MVSKMRLVLPLPLTPVTTVRPSPNSASMSLRLFSLAPLTLILKPFPLISRGDAYERWVYFSPWKRSSTFNVWSRGRACLVLPLYPVMVSAIKRALMMASSVDSTTPL